MDKITISEFEKELQKIDENVKVIKADKFNACDYIIRFNLYTTNLCGFNVGRLEGLRIFIGNTYDRSISDEVLKKAIELIPHLVPDDYKEPTEEELFDEFKEEVEKKGFYFEDRGSEDYVLKFDSRERSSWTIATFNRDLKCCNVISNVDAPIDKYLEGLKLFINYIEKVRALEKEKKYYLKSKWLDGKYEEGYLNYQESLRNFTLAGKDDDETFKTKFTEKEIEEIKEKFGISLEDFEIVEVEDEL